MNGKAALGAMLTLAVLGLWLTKPLSPSVDAATTPAAFDPLKQPLARHITQAHGVHIGANADDDIVVSNQGGEIEVAFQAHFLPRLRDDALFVLELEGPVTRMDRARYNTFLTMLHAYLTMAPPQAAPNRTLIEHSDDDVKARSAP